MNAPDADGKFAFAVGPRRQPRLHRAAPRQPGAPRGARRRRRRPPLAAAAPRATPAGAAPVSRRRWRPAARPASPTACDAYLRTTRLPGTAIVLSDFLVEPGSLRVGARCAARPPLRRRGDPRHRPARARRGGAAAPRPPARRRDRRRARRRADRRRCAERYAEAVAQHLARLRDWCAARAIVCAAVDTAGGLAGLAC